MRRVHLIVMHGQTGGSDVERIVDAGRRAITLDTVDKALATGAFAAILVSTNDLGLAETLSDRPSVVIELDPEEEPFHFGERLQSLIAKHRIERLVYMGGGSAPLLASSTLREIADQVCKADRLVLANNFYSVDFCGVTPASALLSVEPPPNDNGLGWLLHKGAKLAARELPRKVATVFDVDTPVDLQILSLHPDAPLHVRAYLDHLALDTRHIEMAGAVFVEPQAEALVAGRVSSATLTYLDRETLGRTRVFSEERGMRSNGRQSRGEVRSLLAMHIESVGQERFFRDVVPQLAQAAFIDDRVLWAHHKLWPPASDRFSSDLLRPEAISDPWIRSFTEAAKACPVPVVLGGHSLVSGGLEVLVEAAWAHSGLEIQRTLQS